MKRKYIFFFIMGMLLFVTMLLLLETDSVEKIDHYSIMIQTIFSHSSFYIFFYGITNLMTVVGIFFILVFTGFLLRKKDAKKDMKYFLISIISCFLLNNIMKWIIHRSRPLDQLLDVSGYSFPSAHSSISMVVYGFLILLLEKHYQGKRKYLWIGICTLLILGTGLSRIYFHVHYITDVLAGFGLGLGVLSIVSYFYQKR